MSPMSPKQRRSLTMFTKKDNTRLSRYNLARDLFEYFGVDPVSRKLIVDEAKNLGLQQKDYSWMFIPKYRTGRAEYSLKLIMEDLYRSYDDAWESFIKSIEEHNEENCCGCDVCSCPCDLSDDCCCDDSMEFFTKENLSIVLIWTLVAITTVVLGTYAILL